MVTLPGESGVFAITKNHSNVISQLAPGVVTVNHLNVSFIYIYSLYFIFYM